MRLGKYLSSLTKPELEFYTTDANFTDEELRIFNLLSKGYSITEIAIKLSVCNRTINRRVKNISSKISKVGGKMFTVNGMTWNISFVEPTNCNLMRSDKVYTLGVTDNNIKTIFLNNKLYGKMLDKVLCHELVHVYSFENDCEIDIKT